VLLLVPTVGHECPVIVSASGTSSDVLWMKGCHTDTPAELCNSHLVSGPCSTFRNETAVRQDNVNGHLRTNSNHDLNLIEMCMSKLYSGNGLYDLSN
jgi:hypothetical protein